MKKIILPTEEEIDARIKEVTKINLKEKKYSEKEIKLGQRAFFQGAIWMGSVVWKQIFKNK